MMDLVCYADLMASVLRSNIAQWLILLIKSLETAFAA